MKVLHYDKLKSILRSLTESTRRVVEIDEFRYDFNGLCSDLKSYQHIELSRIRKCEHIVIWNSRYVLYLSDKKMKTDMVQLPIPATEIRNLCDEENLFVYPSRSPKWIWDQVVIWVAYPSNFSGFDEEGKPEFRIDVNYLLEKDHLKLHVFDTEEYENHVASDSHGCAYLKLNFREAYKCFSVDDDGELRSNVATSRDINGDSIRIFWESSQRRPKLGL